MKYSEVDKERVQQNSRGQHLEQTKQLNSKEMTKELSTPQSTEVREWRRPGQIDYFLRILSSQLQFCSCSARFGFDFLFKIEQFYNGRDRDDFAFA